MEKQQLIEIVRAKSRDGKIPCEEAHKIADETGTPRTELGELLNELKIKVVACQLGCFP